MTRSRKPKKVSYQVLARDDQHRPIYARLERLIEAHHEELRDARIALAWCTSWKADVDGHVTLGRCKKASDLDRELAAFDFVILLQRDFWMNAAVTDTQREALLDHELCHATVSYDDDGEPKVDERGRTVFRIRKHDIEEFQCIVDRHGTWKHDLEQFAQAIARARSATGGAWVGYRSLVAQLAKAGVTVGLDVVREWSEAERREAAEWAALQIELQDVPMLDQATPPAHVAAARATQES